jgi:hypothetical protein
MSSTSSLVVADRVARDVAGDLHGTVSVAMESTLPVGLRAAS